MAKIVVLDVLNKILKQVYKKTKEYTDGEISTKLNSLKNLIKANGTDITKLQTTTNGLSNNVKDLQRSLGSAESNLSNLQTTTYELSNDVEDLQSRLGTAESNIADLQGKVYDYLGNDEIDTVFE